MEAPAPFNAKAALDAAHAHRTRFATGATLPYQARRDALRALAAAVKKNEQVILNALHADMRKPVFEGYLSEVGLVKQELAHTLAHLREWMRPQEVSTPLALQVAESKVYHQPLGVVLIVAPWNYPVQLILIPLIAAIAAGNCAVVKPSEDAPHAAAVVERIIADADLQRWVSVAQGVGSTVVPALINGFRFDHIFFTGSPRVGALVAGMAAPQLVPVTLELGGKSPAIVDRTINAQQAARRIVWGKCLNAGQTCISPDHALVHADVYEAFIDAFAQHVKTFFGEDPQQSPHFARIINARRFAVLKEHLSHGTVRVGGQHDAADKYIAPTLLTDVPLDALPMREEIFGPILPVLPWREKEEVLAIVQRNPTPLACYTFSKHEATIRFFNERIAFGGGCVNNTLAHFGNPDLPLGGLGTSGMGRYHGRYGFDTFSHLKSVVRSSTWIDPGVQYPPYTKGKYAIVRKAVG